MTDDRPTGGRRSPAATTAAVLAVVAGLAVVAAAVGRPGDRAAALPPDLPWPALVLGIDALIGAGLAAGVLLAIAAAWAFATTRHRGVVERRPWWHTPASLALVAVLTIGLAWMIRRGDLGAYLEYLAEAAAAAAPDGGALEPGLEQPGGEALDPGARRTAVAAGALAVAVAAAVALRVWLRPGREVDEPGEAGGALEHLEEAVAAALDDLDAEADPRTAILRCYAHLDAALAAAGCPRRVAETAREHRSRAAVTLGPAAGAAARVVDRFEHARYDVVPLGETDRREAVAALLEVRAALDATGDPVGHARDRP